MNVVLINWSKGGNDPFSFFNDEISGKFTEFGVRCFRIELDENFLNKIIEIHEKYIIHAAIIWQGIGSLLKLNDGNLLWDHLKIPVISLHGDHPCHMPDNHLADSRYIFHTYPIAAWTNYANKNFKKIYPALTLNQPNFIRRSMNRIEKKGDYFIFPKNYKDVDVFRMEWIERYGQLLPNLMNMIVDSLVENYKSGDMIELHDCIDVLLSDEIIELIVKELGLSSNSYLYHCIHSIGDNIYRNIVSKDVILQLKDYPIHIYGAGWDVLKNKNTSPKHQFKKFDRVADGRFQFDSQFGILDVAPHMHCIHDRTLRAMSFDSGFLINSQMRLFDKDRLPFEDLFYSGISGSLIERAEAVVSNPVRHRERVNDFGFSYDAKYSFEEFYKFVYMTHRLVN